MKARTLRARSAVPVLLAALALSAASGAWAQGTGSADFSKYVALGDSLTAGYVSGGLGGTVQANSYPALIYRQVHGTTSGFEQPTISAPGLPQQLALVGLLPTVLAPQGALPGTPTNTTLPRAYDNLGVPGARATDTLNTIADLGGFHDLILRNPAFGDTTALQQALSLSPSFVSLWIGNNDVLGAAVNGDPALLTPLASFQADFQAIVAALTGAGVQLVIANIPDVRAIPFVDTVPSVLVDPTTNQPVLVGGMPVRLVGPDGMTPLTSADRVLLTASSFLALGCGIPVPLGVAGLPPGTEPMCPTGGLPGGVVLEAAELATIEARRVELNGVIAAAAQTAGAAFVDAAAIFDRIASDGLVIGGMEYDASFLTGGIFSFDGVHPSAFGYAYITNEFLRAINAHYGAAIPLVDLYPFVFGQVAQGQQLPAWAAAGATLSREGLENLQWIVGRGEGVLTDPEGNGGEIERDPETGTPPAEAGPGDGTERERPAHGATRRRTRAERR